MEEQVNYAKLRPREPTPQEELCQCRNRPPIKLMSVLTENPVHCMNCNLEVSPETLGLSSEVIDRIAHWQGLYNALDVLWLDSGAYETWAKEQLSDIMGAVNTLGRDIQRELTSFCHCYYWYFQNQSVDGYCPPDSCPVCGNTLQDYTQGIFSQRVCERDGIVVVGEV